MYYPTVREHSRHHRDSSPVNDHQSDLDIHDDPYAFTKVFHHWTANVDVLFPLFLWYCNIRYLIVDITIPSSISLTILLFTRSMIFHPCDLVTCCNIGWISPSGPKVSFRHVEEQILLLVHTPQPTPLEYLNTPFQSPCYRVTVDVIKAFAGCSDYNVTS
jgi:hypothetical protein